MSKTPRPLNPAQVQGVLETLRELHRVCLRMDLERQDDRPTEEEYQTAMRNANGALTLGGAQPLVAYRALHLAAAMRLYAQTGINVTDLGRLDMLHEASGLCGRAFGRGQHASAAALLERWAISKLTGITVEALQTAAGAP